MLRMATGYNRPTHPNSSTAETILKTTAPLPPLHPESRANRQESVSHAPSKESMQCPSEFKQFCARQQRSPQQTTTKAQAATPRTQPWRRGLLLSSLQVHKQKRPPRGRFTCLPGGRRPRGFEVTVQFLPHAYGRPLLPTCTSSLSVPAAKRDRYVRTLVVTRRALPPPRPGSPRGAFATLRSRGLQREPSALSAPTLQGRAEPSTSQPGLPLRPGAGSARSAARAVPGGPETPALGTRAWRPGSQPAGTTALVSQKSFFSRRVIGRNAPQDAPRPERTCRLPEVRRQETGSKTSGLGKRRGWGGKEKVKTEPWRTAGANH